MFRKFLLLWLFVCLVSFSNSALAGIIWQGDAGDNDWTNPDNWDLGHVPTTADGYVATTTGYGVIGNDPVISSAVPGVDRLYLPLEDVSGGTMLESSLTLEGNASLNIVGTVGFRLGDWAKTGWTIGTLYMKGGVLNVTTDLTVGAAGSTGIIDMTGGVINCGTLKIPATTSNTEGHIFLKGGIIYCDDIRFAPYSGMIATMDIEEGMLVIGKDWQWNVQNGINKGLITGYGDSANVRYNYDSGTNKTTLWAVPEPTTMVLLGLGCFVLRRKK